MSYLVDKLDLKKNTLYRKVKLDIDEVMDNDEAQEELGINMDIYGDNEGYFFVKKKEEDNYLVKFLNLDLLVNNQIISINISPKGNKIDMFNIDDIQKLDKIATEELDFDEMEENYVRLDLEDIVRELIEQTNSKGKKGIKLNEEYLDRYSKEKEIETGSNKKTPITLNSFLPLPIDFIGNYETPLPEKVFNKIVGMDKLKENISKWFSLPFASSRVIPTITEVGEIEGQVDFKVSEDLNEGNITRTPLEFLRILKENPQAQQEGLNYLDLFDNPEDYGIFEKTGIPRNDQIFLQAFEDFIADRRYVGTGRANSIPNTRLFYDPEGIIEQFYNSIKNTKRYKSIEKKLLEYFDSNIKTIGEYQYNSNFKNFVQYDFKTQKEIIEVINSIIDSNVSPDEFSAFVFGYSRRPQLPGTPKPEERYKPNTGERIWAFITPEQEDKLEYPKGIRKSLREGIKGMNLRSELQPYFEISDTVMKEQMDKKYSPSNGKKFIKDNDLKLKTK